MSEVKCKDCAKYKGNCGNHFKDTNGHINYEIPAESMYDKWAAEYLVVGRLLLNFKSGSIWRMLQKLLNIL